MSKLHWLAAGCIALLLSACSSQKAPAEEAVAKLGATLSAIHDSAEKYSPDSLHALEGQVAALKGKLAKGDYPAVLAAAPAVKADIASLKESVGAQQAAADAELAKTKQQWRNLNAEVPKLVAGIQTEVDTLSQTHRLPRGVTKAKFETTKTDAASLASQWQEAVTTVSNGDYAGAVTKGQAVKDKAASLMQQLGMKSS